MSAQVSYILKFTTFWYKNKRKKMQGGKKSQFILDERHAFFVLSFLQWLDLFLCEIGRWTASQPRIDSITYWQGEYIDWMLVCFISEPHTQSKFKFTNVHTRRMWRTIDSCHLVSQSELWWLCLVSCVLLVSLFWKTAWLHIRMLFLSAENNVKQLWTKFLRVLDRCDRTKDQAVNVS